MKAMYTATAVSVGGRNGHVKSVDGNVDMDVRPPKEMGGPGGAANPEELFAAGYSACFNSALNLAARMHRIKVGETTVTVSISIGQDDKNEGYMLAAKIEAEIPNATEEEAEMLINEAHRLCPYSRATRGNIEVELKIK